jgi:hypothetical protein
MNCTGKKRDAIASWRTLSAIPTYPSPEALLASPPVATKPLTPIVFKGAGAYLVAGTHSRQVYCFSSNDPEQLVDARDAPGLVRTGLFRLKA